MNFFAMIMFFGLFVFSMKKVRFLIAGNSDKIKKYDNIHLLLSPLFAIAFWFFLGSHLATTSL
jgi:hypothetical protein